MNQSIAPHGTHDVAADSPQQILGGAVLTAALASLGVSVVAAPLLTGSVGLAVAAALLVSSAAETVDRRVHDSFRTGDSSTRGQPTDTTGGFGTADD